ncbi:MAG: Gfo/Idh/MocA family oxidoreductase [Pirellulaceae bacterium]
MSKLRIAIIGGGHLGRIHAKLAKSNEQFEVIGVADPSPESRQTVAEQLELPTFADYQQLVGRIDAAIIASPTTTHYEVASVLLRAGIHTLVEKPLASTPDQAYRLCQMAANHRRVLQTGHVERFSPTWTTAGPHLGKPKFVEAIRAGAYSGRSTDIGVVMDLMIHDIDLILSLDSSPVEKIHASGIALLGSHEDVAEARVEFASGLIANLRASRLATAATRRMQMFTTESYADIDFAAESVQVIRPSTDVLARCVALDEMSAEQRMEAKDHIFENLLQCEKLIAPGRNAILDEQNDFALSIQTGSAPAVTGEDGARAVELASGIVQAIGQHQWDGNGSKSWRVGALATMEPRILSMPGVAEKLGQVPPLRKAG